VLLSIEVADTTKLGCASPLNGQSRDALCDFARCLGSCDLDGRAFDEVSEPGVLTLGELPRAGLDQGDRFGQGDASFEMIDDFFVSQSLSGRFAQTRFPREQPLHFGYEAGLEHLHHALVDALVKPRAGRMQPVHPRALVFGKRLLPLLN
jgi:hypothetical protein